MRRSILAALLITILLLLPACSGRGDASAVEALRESVQDAAVGVTAEVTVLGTDTAETYTYDYTETEQGGAMTVTAPELLAGVTARIEAGETALEYDGVLLPAPLGEPRRAPLTAVRQILNALRTGHLDAVWREGDAIVAQLIPEDDTALRLYLDASGTPMFAEIILNDTAALHCTLTQWRTERGTSHESNDPNLG